MKLRSILFILALFLSLGFVSAIPQEFQVSKVYWVAKGKMTTSDGIKKDFMLGLVQLSWEDKKGTATTPIVYLNVNDRPYYSEKLGLIKSKGDLMYGLAEVQFFELRFFAGRPEDKDAKYSLIIPIDADGTIRSDLVKFSEALDSTALICDKEIL